MFQPAAIKEFSYHLPKLWPIQNQLVLIKYFLFLGSVLDKALWDGQCAWDLRQAENGVQSAPPVGNGIQEVDNENELI